MFTSKKYNKTSNATVQKCRPINIQARNICFSFLFKQGLCYFSLR